MKATYILVGVMAVYGWPSEAEAAQKSLDARYKEITDYCYKTASSNVDAYKCLSEKVKQLQAELAKEIRHKQFQIGEVANETEPLALHGKDNSDRWRVAFGQEQSSWDSYYNQRCFNVGEFDAYGGSGAAGLVAGCQIRLLLQRLHDLTNVD